MLQELALRVHRALGHGGGRRANRAELIRMATEGGAMTTAFRPKSGGWKKRTSPYQDADIPKLDALVQRARASMSMPSAWDCELVYAEGKFTYIDTDAVLAEIAGILNLPRMLEVAGRH